MAVLKYKIQLHSHLTTGMRHETIWELAQQKGLDLGYKSVEDIQEKTRLKEGTTLANYLKEIFVFTKVVVGDRDAMERVAYEEAVDQAAEGVLYSEMLLCPQPLGLLERRTTVARDAGKHGQRQGRAGRSTARTAQGGAGDGREVQDRPVLRSWKAR
ncbi:hypothetical protein MRX96_038147, partial [Rhipicephalus microplus]